MKPQDMQKNGQPSHRCAALALRMTSLVQCCFWPQKRPILSQAKPFMSMEVCFHLHLGHRTIELWFWRRFDELK
ncbi:MAG: hypothetical protein ACJAR9_001403 [Celeribacter sp.]|jgi:hypothetical protein